MKNKRIELLAHKWLNGTISSEELTEFNRWYTTGLDNSVFIDAAYAHSDEELRNRIFQVIEKNIDKKKKDYAWLRGVAAIFLGLSLVVGGYLYSHKSPQEINRGSHSRNTGEVLPGADEATLILSDGKRIVLSNAQNGKLADQAGVAISKTANGQLVYHITTDDGAKPISKATYNTIETPQGGQYQVILPDGTHVWLNAASSFRYPTSFQATGPRRVELAYGEAYFEVSHDPVHPFVISSGQQELEVLGTHFNINAYPEEAQVKTTLLTGKVKVTDKRSNEEVLLRPGQQSLLSAAGLRVKTLAVGNLQLWKDGKFVFDNESMRSIMPQIARWYKVKVRFRDPVEDVRLSGSVSRFDNLGTLLEKLEQTGLVSFRLEGDQLQVMRP